MKQTNSDKPTVSRGDYLVGTWGPWKNVLLRAEKNSWITDGREIAHAKTVFGEDEDVALPVDELEFAEADADAEYRAEYRALGGRDSKSGIYTLQPDAADSFCPVCGSNVVRFAYHELADVAGEWCATCDRPRHP